MPSAQTGSPAARPTDFDKLHARATKTLYIINGDDVERLLADAATHLHDITITLDVFATERLDVCEKAKAELRLLKKWKLDADVF